LKWGRASAWAIEDTPQDLGLIYGAMGRKGLESIENVGPRRYVVKQWRKAWGSTGSRSDGKTYSSLQHPAVEEQQGAEGLTLGGSGDVPLHGLVGDAPRGGFRRARIVGIAPAVEEDVTRDPADVGLFRAVEPVFQAPGVANLAREPLGCWP
jgi:hypothetical protein